MSFSDFFKKLWEFVKEAIPFITIILLVFFCINSCNNSRRYREQLESVSGSISSIESTIAESGDSIRRQEQLIGELRTEQSNFNDQLQQFESSLSESIEYLEQLIGSEQVSDGLTGAIRATVGRAESIISTTLRGIEETGIE